jgi:glycosyltransferase involved in cell wall biosynthesis
VVVTPLALEGIEAEPGRELVLAQDAAGFVEAVAQLLARKGNDMGLAARARVERKYSWPSNLACIGERLECS